MILNTDLGSKLKLEFKNRIWADRNLEHNFTLCAYVVSFAKQAKNLERHLTLVIFQR